MTLTEAHRIYTQVLTYGIDSVDAELVDEAVNFMYEYPDRITQDRGLDLWQERML